MEGDERGEGTGCAPCWPCVVLVLVVLEESERQHASGSR